MDAEAVERVLVIPEDVGCAKAANSDADLAGRAIHGDMAAFEAIMIRHDRMAYSLSHRYLGNTEDAKDAVQETFLRVYRYLGRYDGSKALSSWIIAVQDNRRSAVAYQLE